MKKWLQRIRGVVGTALTWAAAWFGVGIIFFSFVVFGAPPAGFGLAAVVAGAGVFAVLGLIGGAIFSTVLGITEGRRRFDQMSLPRFASWGALGGLLMSVFFLSTQTGGSLLGTVIVSSVLTVLGAGSAAGSLAIARRAEDRELLEAGEEALGQLEGESA